MTVKCMDLHTTSSHHPASPMDTNSSHLFHLTGKVLHHLENVMNRNASENLTVIISLYVKENVLNHVPE